ncbi:MAG: 4'-phosphopantetheinyl transferase superfamily protein [Planctomycetota bacterium]
MQVLALFRPLPAEPEAPRPPGRELSQRTTELLQEAMLRQGLEPWTPERNALGAPQPRDGWHVSKSHCPTMVAAALAPCPVGIDVEALRWSQVAEWQRVASEPERQLFEPYDTLAFTRLWTAKEALLKWLGVGVAGLSGCRVRSNPSPTSLELIHGERSWLVEQRIEQGHVLSLCVEHPGSISWALA